MRKVEPKGNIAPARTFEINHFYERVIELRRTNPRDFDSLSPAVKISLGQYESQKREAERLQAIQDEPEAGTGATKKTSCTSC